MLAHAANRVGLASRMGLRRSVLRIFLKADPHHEPDGSLLLPSFFDLNCVVCVDVLEHVERLDHALDEICRVLRPGGTFLFDTINRARLAWFVIVFCGERLLRLLPRGTHDPSKFIASAEPDAKLAERGFRSRLFQGLGPHGINRRLDVTFGQLLSKEIMYMGHARL